MNTINLKLTSYHKKPILNFLLSLQQVSKKNKIFLKKNGVKNLKKKYTILKSPHVNKSSRNQIEINNFHYFIFFEKNIEFWYFIFFYLIKIIKLSLKMDLKYKFVLNFFIFYLKNKIKINYYNFLNLGFLNKIQNFLKSKFIIKSLKKIKKISKK